MAFLPCFVFKNHLCQADQSRQARRSFLMSKPHTSWCLCIVLQRWEHSISQGRDQFSSQWKAGPNNWHERVNPWEKKRSQVKSGISKVGSGRNERPLNLLVLHGGRLYLSSDGSSMDSPHKGRLRSAKTDLALPQGPDLCAGHSGRSRVCLQCLCQRVIRVDGESREGELFQSRIFLKIITFCWKKHLRSSAHPDLELEEKLCHRSTIRNKHISQMFESTQRHWHV